MANDGVIISAAQFEKIKETIEREFKAEDFDSKFTYEHETIPEKPTDDYLDGLPNKRLKKMVKRVAKNYDELYTITAVMPAKDTKVGYKFEFIKNRAKQEWMFSGNVVKHGLTRVDNSAVNWSIILGILLPGLGWGYVLLASGLKLLISGPAYFFCRGINKKIKAIIDEGKI